MKSMLTFFDEARKLEMPAWYWKLCLSQGISHPDDTLEELVRSRIVFSNTFEYEANGESQQCPGTTSDGPDPFMGFMGPEN